MKALILTDRQNRVLKISTGMVWFIDFPIMMGRYENTGISASTIEEVFQHFSSKLGYDYMTTHPVMKAAAMSLTAIGRRFFAKVTEHELGLEGDRITRAEVVKAAQGFGLRQCPRDTPLFTLMQTDDLVQPGGEYGQVLYFPSYTFYDKERRQKVIWSIYRPLDFIKLCLPTVDERLEAPIFWAFEIPPEKVTPEDFLWVKNRLPLVMEKAA